MIIDCYILKIYKNCEFLGYVMSYRKNRNGFYRLNKTKNLEKAIQFSNLPRASIAANSLNILKDTLYYDSYFFKVSKITDKEIRKSKLNVLSYIKVKEGILKNK
jgi:hypothetical protein